MVGTLGKHRVGYFECVDYFYSGKGLSVTAFTERELAHLGSQPPMRFRISPAVIWNWGINEPAPGIPAIERRNVAS